jgi:glycosyltransferase involved in cell wall biosynthesis
LTSMDTSSHHRHLPGLSIFFPAYNDANSIAELVQCADRIARQVSDEHEIIVIDDGSRDETPDILNKLAADVSALKVIHHPLNRGYGAALRSGFSAAGKEWVFYTDGDGQYDPNELVNLIEVLDDSVDAVNGFKVKRQDSLLRDWIGKVYGWVIKHAFHLPIRDVDCDFRLIRREKVAAIQLTCDSGAICVELIKKLQLEGCHFIEVPVHHYPRRYGHSYFFRLGPVWKTIRQLVSLSRVLSRYPLREKP